MPQDEAATPPEKLYLWNANGVEDARQGVGFRFYNEDAEPPKSAALYTATLLSSQMVDGAVRAIYHIKAVDIVVIIGPPMSAAQHAAIRAVSRANILDPEGASSRTAFIAPRGLLAQAINELR